MDQINIRLHHAVSDIDGDTGMRILGAIVGGERDPHVLTKLRDRRCRKSEAEIAEELTGNWREDHLFTLRQTYETLVFVQERIASFDIQIRAMFARLARESDKPDPPDSPQDPKMSKSEKNSTSPADGTHATQHEEEYFYTFHKRRGTWFSSRSRVKS